MEWCTANSKETRSHRSMQPWDATAHSRGMSTDEEREGNRECENELQLEPWERRIRPRIVGTDLSMYLQSQNVP